MTLADKYKGDFPILKRKIGDKPLIYLDNTATTQKPRVVIEAEEQFYISHNANIHRGLHLLSEEATEMYEATRKAVAKFIDATYAEEIVFTRNATEGVNLVSQSWAKQNLKTGDAILISVLEHHSNIVPWQNICAQTGAKLLIVGLDTDKQVDQVEYKKLLKENVKLVAMTGMSNVLGVKPPLKDMIKLAHQAGALFLVDVAQLIAHDSFSVKKMNCDFAVFSAHKMMGPTGVGVLYGRRDLLSSMPPFMYGGDMVTTVSLDVAEYREVPYRFEAGTPNIAGVVAFKSALDYISSIGQDEISKHEKLLIDYAREKISKLSYVQIHTPVGDNVGGILDFSVKGVHAHDVAAVLNAEGVAIRSGYHCAEPLHKSLNLPATARMSFYLYNTEQDIDTAVKALEKCAYIFSLKV